MLVRTEPAPEIMLKVAFASDNRVRVNLHFGSATAFVLYDVTPIDATLSGVGEFSGEAMDGNENKLLAKVDFLTGCDAVFVHAIGASAIKQLLGKGIQPVRVEAMDTIDDLLREIRAGMREGGAPWIERALAARAKAAHPDRFAAMDAEGWDA
ncbi:MAG: nitrogen fixation protein NifX [Azoarcus sp.]|jgi:nitrogen fixation protein NifX|nr:nitrogen fixation protein NifX [Azoarcus sp.]